MRSLLLRFRRDQRGATLVLTTLTMAGLLGFSAIVIDLGNARQVKRQLQNAADTAALAAARGFLQPDSTCSTYTALRDKAACEAKLYVEKNFGVATTSPDWADATLCPTSTLTSDDPKATVAYSGPVGATNCISFNDLNTRVRVRVPKQKVDFNLAKALGYRSTRVGAYASSEIQTPAGGHLLPLGLLASAGNGMQCIEQSGNNSPCHLLNTGNFGSLTSPRYRSFVTSGDAANFALGMDHTVLIWQSGAPDYCDTNATGDRNKCQSITGGDWNNDVPLYDLANWAWTTTGNNLQDPTEGLVADPTSPTITARLKRADGADPTVAVPPGSPTAPTLNVIGETITAVHLRRFMTPAAQSTYYPTCNDGTQNVDDACYDAGNAALSVALTSSPTILFTKDIVDSPRFGWVPVIDGDGNCASPPSGWPTGNSGPVKVCDVKAIYIDRLYTNGKGKGSGGKVIAIRAFLFDPDFIESKPAKPGVGMQYVGGPFVTNLVR